MKFCKGCKHQGNCSMENATVEELLDENKELLTIGTLGEMLNLNDDIRKDITLVVMGQLAKTSMVLSEINDRYETLLEAEEALNEAR